MRVGQAAGGRPDLLADVGHGDDFPLARRVIGPIASSDSCAVPSAAKVRDWLATSIPMANGSGRIGADRPAVGKRAQEPVLRRRQIALRPGAGDGTPDGDAAFFAFSARLVADAWSLALDQGWRVISRSSSLRRYEAGREGVSPERQAAAFQPTHGIVRRVRKGGHAPGADIENMVVGGPSWRSSLMACGFPKSRRRCWRRDRARGSDHIVRILIR